MKLGTNGAREFLILTDPGRCERGMWDVPWWLYFLVLWTERWFYWLQRIAYRLAPEKVRKEYDEYEEYE